MTLKTVSLNKTLVNQINERLNLFIYKDTWINYLV